MNRRHLTPQTIRVAQRLSPWVIGALLLLFYLPTFQTIPNGSDHYYMIDVGETQVVLNVWGTLHMTGYPHYTILSGLLVSLFKLFGISAAAAPTIPSLIWGLVALAVLFWLLVRLTDVFAAFGAVLVFGLTRTVWIHHVIAEVYTFGLLLLVLLFWLALRPNAEKNGAKTIYWLALIGGIGVAHHRAIAMAIPALIYAVYPILRAQGKKLPRVIVISLVLGLIGFIPYIYLPLRAQAGAAWVYGDPGTLNGFLDQFFGREASRFIGGVNSFESLIANLRMVTEVLFTDMTAVGVILGMIGLSLGVWHKPTRHAAITIILSGVAAYLFHVFVYTDILSALILAVEVSLAVGWAFAIMAAAWVLIARTPYFKKFPLEAAYFPAVVLVIAGLPVLNALHTDMIMGLTQDQTGIETRAVLENAPPDSTLMIAWGPRHFAAGFWHDVEGVRPDVTIVDHKGDYAAALQSGLLVTPDYTFYQFPLEWWENQLGSPVYLSAAAPHLVEISTEPRLGEARDPDGLPFKLSDQVLCDAEALTVLWGGFGVDSQTRAGVEIRDYSVFVHLRDANGNVVAQGDQSAPVYGWYPFSRWQQWEQVSDIYPLPGLRGGNSIHYGLYYQAEDGSFVNVREYELPIECGS